MVRQSIPPRTLRKTHWQSQCEWGHPCNSRYIFIPFCLSLLELKRSLLTEKFSSWAEETSIWLRNNTNSEQLLAFYIDLIKFQLFLLENWFTKRRKNNCSAMTKAKRLQMSSRWETHSPSNGDVGWHGRPSWAH